MAPHQAAQWTGTPSIKGSTESIRMALLTFSLIGLQFTWGVEMTYCTPYLLQLGLTKSKLSLVWIAGPLSGLIMQPIVGIMADKSKSKYGRRRPVMIAGSIIVGVCLLILGWTSEIAGLLFAEVETHREMTIVIAVLSIYALDFAINAVQSSCRSLIVDTLPISQQQMGSAWAGRMVSIGHLIGYGFGALDLTAVFGGLLGDTQFKQMTVIAAFALVFATSVTSWAVNERVLISDGSNPGESGIIQILSTIWYTTRNLPPRIQSICNIQFWTWIGWFPFLFYSSTWVGELYMQYDAPESVKTGDPLATMGRVGSMALIVFSIMTFIGSVSFPWLVRSPADETRPGFTPRPPEILRPLMPFLPKQKPSLLTVWIMGHFTFSAAMVFAPFIASVHAASIIVAICGLPWALASWAPFTFMGVEINRLGSTNPSDTAMSPEGVPLTSVHRAQSSVDMEANNHSPTATILHLRQDSLASNLSDDPSLFTSNSGGPHSARRTRSTGGQTGELAGIYLGILNLYTTLPQFVATGISTVVFALFEPGKSEHLAGDAAGGDGKSETKSVNGIAVCLFIGAFSSVIAAWCTRRFARDYARDE